MDDKYMKLQYAHMRDIASRIIEELKFEQQIYILKHWENYTNKNTGTVDYGTRLC